MLRRHCIQVLQFERVDELFVLGTVCSTRAFLRCFLGIRLTWSRTLTNRQGTCARSAFLTEIPPKSRGLNVTSTHPQLLPFHDGKEDYPKSLHVSNSVSTLCSTFSTSCLQRKGRFEGLFALPNVCGITCAIDHLFLSFDCPVCKDSFFWIRPLSLFALSWRWSVQGSPWFQTTKCI